MQSWTPPTLLAGRDERVGLIASAFGAVFTANGGRDRAGREIERIADQLQILERHRGRARRPPARRRPTTGCPATPTSASPTARATRC